MGQIVWQSSRSAVIWKLWTFFFLIFLLKLLKLSIGPKHACNYSWAYTNSCCECVCVRVHLHPGRGEHSCWCKIVKLLFYFQHTPRCDGWSLSWILTALLCNLSKQWVSRFVYKGTECNSEWESGLFIPFSQPVTGNSPGFKYFWITYSYCPRFFHHWPALLPVKSHPRD